MSTRASTRILPMKTAGTRHLIERAYRESGELQWVRETLINGIEAGATRVEFGVEWQAVESQGIYRRLIADNGCGMTPEELVGFFNTFGGGGKPIGGVHENFGVGAKTSLLPWNRHGVVVVSWVDGDGAMIWVQVDPETGEYGLRLLEAEDPETGEISIDPFYAPFDDEEHGCDWNLVKPSWINDHGTVIVLMGNEPSFDTVLGDPNRSEADIKGISSYLNRRLWEIPDGVDVIVDELRTQERAGWPPTESVAHGPQPKHGTDRRTNSRHIEGAQHYITYPEKAFKKGSLAHHGTVKLSDETRVHWFLWEGDRPAVQSYASISGYIGALYKNELYDVTFHHSTYRSFGIMEASVRRNVWLVLEPLPLADGKQGVYPRTDRNALLLRGGPNPGGALPINHWAGEFADRMAEEAKPLLDAIRKARAGQSGTIQDQTWRERLAERFGSRWRIPKLRARLGGGLAMTPSQDGTLVLRVRRVAAHRTGTAGGGGRGGTSGSPNTGSRTGTVPAVKTTVSGGVPTFRTVAADAMTEGMLAAWAPNDPEFPEGVVLLNVEHPVLLAEIEHWQGQYPDHYADQIAQEIIHVYGEMAVAKVAHSEHLKGILPSPTVENDLRSEAALTMALLGLIGEEAVIAPRIGGKFRRKSGAA